MSKELHFSPERKLARRFDTPYRSREITDQVYTGEAGPYEIKKVHERFAQSQKDYLLMEPSPYNIYFGELHGHTRLSDGGPTPDEYYLNIRDRAKLDFAALTDHTHGGVGHDTLFGEKWDQIRAAAKKYNNPGTFSTILGAEIEAYPYYNNAVVYHSSHDADVVRSAVNGDFTHAEMKGLLEREDLIVVPHDTYAIEPGCDFAAMPEDLFTPLIEIFSRGDCAEYMGNPWNTYPDQCEGGFWQDALRRGAKMGCIGASDDHGMTNGITLPESEGFMRYPGITGVLAEENTPEAIFRAIKARRCYGFMGGRMWVDFRINGHFMGEEFTREDDLSIYYKVEADAPVDRVILVKNCRDYIISGRAERLLYDYRQETDCDYYYLRILLKDGRCGWTSPIWIQRG